MSTPASTLSTMSSRNNSPRPGVAGPSALRTSHIAPRSAASPSTATRGLNVGSATQTITPPDSASSRSVSPEPLVLRLRGAHDASGSTSLRRRITWAEDVVDNEGLGRKSSKVCCIYHRPREFGESSSEEDSSDSDSNSDNSGGDSGDDGGARMTGNRRGRKFEHNHGKGAGGDGCGKGKGKRKPSPNAYEKMPSYHAKGGQQQVKR